MIFGVKMAFPDTRWQKSPPGSRRGTAEGVSGADFTIKRRKSRHISIIYPPHSLHFSGNLLYNNSYI